MAKTLKQALPPEFSRGEYELARAQRYADVEVVREFDGTKTTERWPGKHKHVYFWVSLVNGYAVGWNENPGRGWSFPVVPYEG